MDTSANGQMDSSGIELIRALPIIAAIIAASIGFIAALVIERIRYKRKIRDELIFNISGFFNERKIVIAAANLMELHSAIRNDAFDNYVRYGNQDERSKEILKYKFEYAKEIADGHYQAHNESIAKLTVIEGKILANLLEIKKIYGFQAYRQINLRLGPFISASNLTHEFLVDVDEYDGSNEAELEDALHIEIDKMQNKQHQYCMDVSTHVSWALS